MNTRLSYLFCVLFLIASLQSFGNEINIVSAELDESDVGSAYTEKPVILSIEKEFHYNSDYTYNALFTVHYTGADYIYVEVEEDYNPGIRTYMIDEPLIAHVQTGNITSLYDSWVTFTVSNQYGESTETLHFEPTYSLGYEDNTTINGYELNNIQYDYTVYSKDDGTLDCVGNLSFSIPIPKGLSHIILAKTKPHYYVEDYKDIRYNTKLLITPEADQTMIDFRQDNIFWGTYFRIAYFLDNGDCLCSPIYSTNSYISTADLEKLTASASVTDILWEDCGFSYNGATGTFEVKEGSSVEIFDTTGLILFNGSGEQNVSLAHLQGKCVIIRCVTNNGVFTKKLIL